MTVVDEIMTNLKEACLGQQNLSGTVDPDASETSDSALTFLINNFTNLLNIIQNLQKLQNEIYVDNERHQLSKLLDFKLSCENLPGVRLFELGYDDLNILTTSFEVRIYDSADQIKHKFKFIMMSDQEQLRLSLPKRSVKLSAIGGELFLLEKTGDLYKVLPNGACQFLLGHLFSFSDVQFVTDDLAQRVKYIISADRDEKLRITNYPQTFDIERYCFGHRSLVSRILIANEQKFVSIDQEGEVCVWDLRSLSVNKSKPLTPIHRISTNDETVKKRMRVE